MKFYVTDRCIGCGLCTGICPDVFEMNGDRAQAVSEPATDAEKSKAEEAMAACPVDAIEKA